MKNNIATKPMDSMIGERIRKRRKELKIGLYSLAYDLEISFQQLQKYEKGINRISASKLYEIAKILEVSPNYFFEGIDIEEVGNNNELKITNLANKFKNQEIKNKILELISELEGK